MDSRSRERSPESPALDRYGDLHILLIEDNPGDVKLIEKRLAQVEQSDFIQDHELITSNDLTTGIELLETEPVDIVLLDLGLPECSGIETIERLLSHNYDVPIIVLTGLQDQETAIRAIQKGAQDYLDKGALDGNVLKRSLRYAIERHRINSQLSTSLAELQLYKAAVENAGQSIFLTDPNGVIEYANPAFEKSTGYSREQAIGATPRILKSNEHDAAFFEDMWDTITAGEVWSGEIINERADGTRYTITQTITPIFDDDGEIEHYVAVNAEITEQVKREQQLQVLNRLFRHNLLTEMNLIQGYAKNLAESLSGEGELLASNIVERSSEVVSLSQKVKVVREINEQPDSIRSVDVVRTVREACDSIRAEYAHAEVSVDVPHEAEARGDDNLVTAIRELCENAIVHADTPHPELSISVVRTEGPNARVKIKIADVGPGIPEEEKSVLREGRETQLKHSSGLGLWVVHWIVREFGGELTITENTPRGTVITIILPAV